MIRFAFKFIICLLLAGGTGIGLLAWRSGDPIYTVYEWLSPARFQQYDQLILTVARNNELDPMLVKAVVWRESRFDSKKLLAGRLRDRDDVGDAFCCSNPENQSPSLP